MTACTSRLDITTKIGMLVGISYKSLDATTNVFNPDDDKPVVVISVGVSF